MEQNGWRTVIVGNGEHLSLRDGCLLIQGTDQQVIPLLQIREVIIERPRGSITLALLEALSSNQISVLLCDEKSSPSGELISISDHHQTAGMIIDQSRWTHKDKVRVWQRIVQDKLRMQQSLMERMGVTVPDSFRSCQAAVLPGDSDNREGAAARLYFARLFGSGFVRHSQDGLNGALNYGYAILRSTFNRILAVHGYHTALGIWHCSRTNRFNLSCDLMEPFRPFVDEIVFRHREEEWDWAYRKRLISLLHTPVCFDGKKTELPNAAEQYAIDVLRSMKDQTHKIREVSFN